VTFPSDYMISEQLSRKMYEILEVVGDTLPSFEVVGRSSEIDLDPTVVLLLNRPRFTLVMRLRTYE
jgi:hypothetical protein